MQQAMSVPDPIAKYDPTGHTNEDMAEYPVLTDLTGNGHDISCNNFAWSGMSGIGGYCQDFRKWSIQNGSYEELINNTYNSISIRLTDVPSRSMILLTFVKKINYSASNYRVKVHSTNNNLEFGLRFIFDNGL